MPTRPRAQAPADRVYSSEPPQHQVTFKPQKRRIKSYGRQNGSRKAKQDNTLTQMDWVKLQTSKLEDEDPDGFMEEEKKRPKKRRKTMNDEHQSSSNQYQQQTLTQIERSFTSTAGDDDIIGSSPPVRQAYKDESTANEAVENNMLPPPTPHRILKLEIPSSQSPATPPSFSLRSAGRGRSVLSEGSINTPIPFKLAGNTKSQPGSARPVPKLEIKDTFESEETFNPSSSAPQRSSPAKNVRFAVPGDTVSGRTSSPTVKTESDAATTTSTLSSTVPSSQSLTVKLEILDSDADSDEEDPAVDQGTPTRSQETAEEALHDTCYDELGPETQVEAERLLTCSEASEKHSSLEDDTRLNNEEDTAQEEVTQAMESQRLSTQYVNAMAPRTMKSDIIISIHPQHVNNIVNRSKDHEFRSWPVPQGVSRLWIYETRPTSELRYMAVIGTAKRPGEITDIRGLGNASFNAQTGSLMRYAYEILELYELADPLSLEELREKEWISSPPQKYVYVRPAVLDQLIANLKPALFVSSAESEDNPSSPLTVSQEAEAQLLSDAYMHEQTQHQSIPSSHHDENGSSAPATPRKLPTSISQATTVDITPTQSPAKVLPSSPFTGDIVHDSPIPSSIPMELPKLRKDQEYDDEDATAECDTESVVPFSMASSQLLTKSQMLPDSLLNDSGPEPPAFIADSDEED
ncbi:hypothetical protein F5884DRAFT_804834 [Xylogone sp. PMI_703]|nr:hypothetical protein F5884DRAFT_804834 [Xylogone sp. PMI_703]